MRSIALRKPLLSLCTAAAVATIALPAEAGGTRTHHIGSFSAFDDGEAEGAAIEGSGRVTVGYTHERHPIAEVGAAFSCFGDKSSAWVGTSEDARIVTLRPGKDPVELAKLDGAVVSAIGRLPGGDLLAATLPGGTIHRVTPKGKVSEFAKLDVEAIWTLVVHDGRLWVGTGPKGELYSLGLDGKNPKVVLDSNDKHVLAVLPVGKQILAGTSGRAQLLQVGGKLEGTVLHQFRGDEVRALALSGNTLLVAVNDFEDRGVGNLQSLSKQLSRTALGGSATKSTNVQRKSPDAEARLFALDLGPKRDLARASEAAWSTWLEHDKQFFTAVLPVAGREAGALVSSSRAGKIYRVRSRRDRATVADLEERQAMGLCRSGKTVWALAGDGAAAYELDAARGKKAKYRTEVLDADQPAVYGAVLVRADGKVSVRARSGPSDEPDERWSSWSPVKLVSDSAGQRGQLGAPKRRYLQLEVTLGTPDAAVRDIVAFYAPENLPPMLSSVSISPPDFDLDDDDEPDAKSKIKWKVDDVDDDDLIYEVRLRPEGGEDDEWIDLTEGEPTAKKELSLELESVPDGVYEVEVVASDEPSNGRDDAGTDAMVSDPFIIDRSRPTIVTVDIRGDRVRGTVADTGSHIHDVAFAIDAGEFRAVSPDDGLWDSGRESFDFRLPALEPGAHRIVVRVRDAHGNFTTRALSVRR
jgi:hypothetical protein